MPPSDEPLETHPQPWLQGYLAALDDFLLKLDTAGSLPEMREWLQTTCRDTEDLLMAAMERDQPLLDDGEQRS